MAHVLPKKGTQTRERLLDLAESAVLQNGFAGTSIDELIAAAEISKSGFLYHFADKNELAKALLERYLARDDEILDEIFAKADALNDDPLHGFLVGLKLLADMMGDLPRGHPGCLVAAYRYQDQLFSREVRERSAAGVRAWRQRFRARLDRIAGRYKPQIEVDLDDLADMVSAMVDGGIILSKVLGDPKALSRQVMLYRAFVRAVFEPE